MSSGMYVGWYVGFFVTFLAAFIYFYTTHNYKGLFILIVVACLAVYFKRQEGFKDPFRPATPHHYEYRSFHETKNGHSLSQESVTFNPDGSRSYSAKQEYSSGK
jgi:hypothetical protein